MKAKSAMSVGVALMLGLSLTCTANAESSQDNKVITDPIKACVAEIGERADYDGADRVVHVVSKLEQKNLVEKRIEIETSVHADQERGYKATCVTGNLGKIIKFRLLEGDGEARS